MAYKMKYPSTICWECANAYGKCSWSKSFEPVVGWTAEATVINSNYYDGATSYKVMECPEFVEG